MYTNLNQGINFAFEEIADIQIMEKECVCEILNASAVLNILFIIHNMEKYLSTSHASICKIKKKSYPKCSYLTYFQQVNSQSID